jgi:hypothetical protein
MRRDFLFCHYVMQQLSELYVLVMRSGLWGWQTEKKNTISCIYEISWITARWYLNFICITIFRHLAVYFVPAYKMNAHNHIQFIVPLSPRFSQHLYITLQVLSPQEMGCMLVHNFMSFHSQVCHMPSTYQCYCFYMIQKDDNLKIPHR